MSEWQPKVLEWLANGETGLSSETMAFWIGFGVLKKIGRHHHPHDPADFDRCLRLLDAVPEMRPHLAKMAYVSDAWKKLVERWHDIERQHLKEVGLGWTKALSAPKTYALMKSVLGDSQ